MSNEQETMRLIKTKIDPTADGRFVRVLVGKRGDDISGAIYLDASVPLPKSILLAIPSLGGSEASQDVVKP